MKTFLVSLQYFDDSTFDGIWVDIERLFVCDHVLQIEEWVSDMGWQMFQALPLNAFQIEFHKDLKTVKL
jgi:hypothetical protein